MNSLFSLLHTAENLKFEMRHSWLSNGDQESVASHCWRMSLMAALLGPRLDRSVDMEKVLTMAIIHDLPEAKVGDLPHFDDLKACQERDKFQSEQSAMSELAELAEDKSLYDLWMEFEQGETYEAKFVRALDKLEMVLQHIEAGVSTWDTKEVALFTDQEWLQKYCGFDPYLSLFAMEITQKAQDVVRKAQAA